MKKVLIALTLGFGFITAPGNPSLAQSSKKLNEPNIRKSFMPSIRNLGMLQNTDLTGAYVLNRNEINICAVRDFMNRFDKVDNAIWFLTAKAGFEAYFIQDGYGERVIYDKCGGWQSSLITYNEDKLPRDIRIEVKSAYFDMDISLVEEVQTMEGVEYMLNLEDKSNIRVIKVNNDGVMEVLQDLNK